MKQLVNGEKAGSKSAAQPKIASDSAKSLTEVDMTIGLTEGEIDGFERSDITLDGTPLTALSNEIICDYRFGTNNQTHIDGLDDVSNEVQVGVEIKDVQPWVKAITNTSLDALLIRLSWSALRTQHSNGDVDGATVSYRIELAKVGESYATVLDAVVSDKTSDDYQRTHEVTLPPSENGWMVRVVRTSPNSTSDLVSDKMYIRAYSELIKAKFTYPYTAYLRLKYDAEMFSNIAKVAVEARGLKIKVPTNYNVEAGTVSGIWDGQFKLAYSNNPAWVYYDICTNARYGLGDRIKATMIDKWSLYRLAQYCDQQVEDGYGGLERRFTVNLYIQSKEKAYDIVNRLGGLFRAITFWDGQQIICDADIPQDTFFLYTNSNVKDGLFEYSDTAATEKYSAAIVAWDNPVNKYETEYEAVVIDELVQTLGYKALEIDAWGCTSKGQAVRAGRWALLAETDTVTFSVGMDGNIPIPGKIIEVQDQLHAGVQNGGRILEIFNDLKTVKIDKEIEILAGDMFIVNGPSGTITRTVAQAIGQHVTVTEAFEPGTIEIHRVWILNRPTVVAQKFRILSIKSDDNTSFTVSAVRYNQYKFDEIDFNLVLDKPPTSVINPTAQDSVRNVTIEPYDVLYQGLTNVNLVIKWERPEYAVKYLVEWKKDNGSWIKLPLTGNNSVEIEKVYAGNYMARVTAISAFDLYSLPVSSTLVMVKGKQTMPLPPSMLSASSDALFAIKLSWALPANSQDIAYTRILTTSQNPAVIQLDDDSLEYVDKAYPDTSATFDNLPGNLELWFKIKVVDKLGLSSPYTSWVKGVASSDPDKILEILKGHIGIEAIDAELARDINLANINAISALNTANATKLQTETAVNKLNQDLAAESSARIDQAKDLQNGITTAQSTADGAVNDLKTYKESNDTAIGALTQSVTAAVNNSSVAIQKTEALDGRVTTLQQTTDALGNRVTDAETNAATALTQSKIAIDENKALSETVQSNTAAIGTKAESSYVDQVKVTAESANSTANTNAIAIQGLKSTVDGNASSINTINQTKANKDEVASIAQQALQSVWKSDSQNQIDAIKIGGRNLVRNSLVNESRTGYPFFSGALTQTINEGEKVTVTVWGTLESGTRMAVHNSGGNVQLSWLDYVGNGQYQGTFDWVVGGSANSYINLYAINHQTGGYTIVDKVKVEKGTKGTDWTAAPEDIAADLADFKSSVAQTYQTKADAQSTTANLTTQIESRATITQAQNFANDAVKNATIGGENLIRGTQFFETSGNLRPNYAGFGDLYNNPNDRLFGTNYIYLVSTSWSGFNFTGFPNDTLQEDCVLSFWASSQNNSKVDVYNTANGTFLGSIEGAVWKQYAFNLPKGTKVVNNSNQGVVEFQLIDPNNVLAYGAIQLQRGNKATDWAPSPLDTKVGGKNILRNSEFKQGMSYWSIYDSQYSIIDVTVNNVATKYIYLHGGVGGLYMKPEDQTYVAQPGDIMTISFYARGEGQMSVGFEDVNQLITLERNGDYFKRYTLTFKRTRHDNVILYLRGTYVDLLKPKVELGNVATDWTPAPEDIQNVVSEFRADVTNNYSTKADTSSAVASGISEFNANLGNIKTYSASSSYSDFAGIRNAKGVILNQTWRSYGIDVFNSNGDWARTYRYDVYGNPSLADEVAARINECSPNETIVVTTLDEPQGNRNGAMRAAFISIGGTGAAFDNIGYRNIYLLVGMKGLKEGGGLEQLTSDGSITLPLQFINGRLAGFTGSVGQQLQINANASLLTQTEARVTNHDGQISSLVNQTTTLTSNVTQAQNTANQAIVDAGNAISNKTADIDLTNPLYGQDTWYPVGIGGLSSAVRSNIQIYSNLDNRSHPNWATHANGFAINIQWNTIGSGWGIIPVDRIINSFTYLWTLNNVSPIIRQDQFGASSIEIVWLRGGAKYYANFPKSAQIWMPDLTTGKLTDPSSGSTVDAILYTEAYMPKSVAQTTTTNTVTLQQQAQVIDGIQAKWTVKINNNGYSTGFGLISQPNNGAIVSAFMVDADAFVVGKAGTNIKPIVAVVGGQTVEGVYYPESGTYLNVAWIAKATISNAHIANAAINTAKISDAAITAAKIQDASITTAKIVDANITTLKIQDRAVTVPYLYVDNNPTNLNQRFGNFPSSSGGRVIPVISAFTVSGLTPYSEVMVLVDARLSASITHLNSISSYLGTNTEVAIRLLNGYYSNSSTGESANAQRIGDYAEDLTFLQTDQSSETGTTTKLMYYGTQTRLTGTVFKRMTADAYGSINLSLWISSVGSVNDNAVLKVSPISAVNWYVLELKK